MSEFFTSLSKDFSILLDHSDDYNVIIRVGDEKNEKTFQAHSVILRARSPYFKRALSNDWARKEGGSTVFTKPNVSPAVFEIILKYIYSGSIDLSNQDPSHILELLIASDELLLQELFNHVQDYLLQNKSEWMKKNVVRVHRTINPRDGCKRLQDFCLETICKNPLLVFKSEDFSTFEESLLLPLLSRDDLQTEEIEIWDHLIQWGIAQMNLSSSNEFDDSSLVQPVDVSKWENKDFKELQRILKNCIPLIRFFEISSSDFYDKVWPFNSILPKDLREDIIKFHLKPISRPINPLHKPRLIPFDSTLIKQEHVARLCDWIDRKDGKPYKFEDIPYKFKLLVRGSKDGFESEVFHEKCDRKGPTIVVMQIAYSGELVGGYNPIEWTTGDTRITTQNSFLFSFPKQGNIADAKLSRVSRPGYAIRVKDKSHGPCFGDKDLWMKQNFNAYDSCSSDKDDYQERVTTLSKFWVLEYEVFQVVKK
ncbi:hypothetical protein RclHR1_02480018 [Rhizophagus clarus]|uniref:BTB domain-containing protein n=1 Tax=Rhizophagus clarus TaxID=94130 RepID=A0A2Z6RC12_9GLOM|nr:hypothetical protein RclHR1_02480018 [Rhizophagus clarus]